MDAPREAVRFDDLPELLTPEELGGYLRLSRNTVYELIRRGDVRSVRFGRAIRIPKAALRPFGGGDELR